MKPRNIALVFAIGWFVFWLAVMYAGADHPPPWGFIWIVLLDVVAACLVYLQTPTYLRWAGERRPWRRCRAVGQGILVGLSFAAIMHLRPQMPQPGVNPTWGDKMIWYAVLAAVGAINGAVLYGFSAAARRLGALAESREAGP